MRKVKTILIALGAFICCYPLIFLVTGSITGKNELAKNLLPIINGGSGLFAEWGLFPKYITIQSYVELLIDTPAFFIMFWNSVKISVGVVVGQLIFGAPTAWGLAKYKFLFKKQINIIYIVLMFMPFQVIMLPEYLVLDYFNILDTLWSIILPGVFSSFPVVIMYGCFRAISDEILEAARLDGAGEWTVFFRIGIPVGMPGIVSSVLLNFLEFWNIIEQPMTFLKDKTLWPLSMFLPTISMEHIRMAFVTSIITLIPCILVFWGGEEYLQQGITTVSIKE